MNLKHGSIGNGESEEEEFGKFIHVGEHMGLECDGKVMVGRLGSKTVHPVARPAVPVADVDGHVTPVHIQPP